MFSENGLRGEALITATVKAIATKLGIKNSFYGLYDQHKIRLDVVDVYTRNEYFDGEPIDPNAFADAMVKRSSWFNYVIKGETHEK